MIRSEGGVLLVEGAVSIGTVPGMVGAIDEFLASGISSVDFGGVTDVDSSAVALALEWRRRADKHGVSLKWANMPPALQNLANLYGVTELLPAAA